MNETEGNSGEKCIRSGKRSYPDMNELIGLSNEALIEKIMRLQAQNTQLKNILQKQTEVKAEVEASKNEECLDSYPTRHVFLKLFYLGWNYNGFVAQESGETVEFHLHKALQRCCLIGKNKLCNYQVCGRTDKGVSALSQVISIDLKSRLKEPSPDNCNNEYNYLAMINRLLPDDIRCYAWAHVGSTVGARFDCTSRTYQYYFPKGNLDIKSMKEAAKHLIGEHDFRNFCKMDIGNGVLTFVRNVISADVLPCSASDSDDNDYSMYKFVITANAFLWHQIRYIMSVIILVGERKESPDIVKELLDVKSNPQKPQYQMSHHEPLIFFDNCYSETEIKWNTNKTELDKVMAILRRHWSFLSIKEVMLKEMMDEIWKANNETEMKFDMERLLIGKPFKIYKLLLSRGKCATLEERIAHYLKREKLVEVKKEGTTTYMSIKQLKTEKKTEV